LLKSIAAGSGAIAAGKSLPESWSKPVVDSVILPAHAQTSPPGVTGITDLRLVSTTLTIGGPTVDYDIDLNNASGTTLSVVGVQSYIEQGVATRSAGGFSVGFASSCNGGAVGELPPGSCTQAFSIIASNANAGSGTLVPGAAIALLELRDDGVLIDERAIGVTLV
ncbi:MAG: hypothetical protein KAJ95_04110, partial [Gammaproteobacteria bacterium]|nr:hypothetical protein [Gammaproteobacteria bacterium]